MVAALCLSLNLILLKFVVLELKAPSASAFRANFPRSTPMRFPRSTCLEQKKNADDASETYEEGMSREKAASISTALSSDVQDVMRQMIDMLAAIQPPDLQSSTKSTMETSKEAVERNFESIMDRIKGADLISANMKDLLAMEFEQVATEAAKDNYVNLKSFSAANGKILDDEIPKTNLLYESSAPYCIVFGPGPVGSALRERLAPFEKAVSARYLDADQINVISDAELRYAVKGTSTFILAADNVIAKSKGWFDKEEPPSVLTERSLKRLLNCINKERGELPVKVVALGKANKQPKSITSVFAGEASDIDSEVILQCQQRQIGYLMMKTGDIVFREIISKPSGELPSSDLESKPALVFTRSRVPENEAKTDVSTAVEALMRAVGYPSANSSISVLSTPYGLSPQSQGQEKGHTSAITSEQWDDEFVKILGPELLRIPLLYASPLQTALKLGAAVQEMQRPESGLITPIEVERFSNGVRILFKPKESSYTSAREEKARATEEEAASKLGSTTSTQKKGYISPEMEAKLMKSDAESSRSEFVPVLRTKALKPEGGLEVIVDGCRADFRAKRSMNRVRIRRCNMGPLTVVKEESEAIILRVISRVVQTLDNDFKAISQRKRGVLDS